MLVQDYVKQYGWDKLTEELFIEVKEYPDGYRVLNYSQIDSPKSHPIVMECRGLILDDYINVVCRPFSRFFNYGEADTKDFDFSNVTIFEKADGSLVKVWFNRKANRWEIGTRGSAYAEVNHVFGTKTDWTFREAILDAMGFTEEQFQKCMAELIFHQSCTYVMEYCSPFNRIVTRYDTPHMVLLAVISNETGISSDYRGLIQWQKAMSSFGMNVRLPQVYRANGADEIVKLAESLDNLQEGFVVYDNNTGKRLKVKSSTYVNVHYLRGNGTPSPSRLMEVVLKNEQEELLDYFPEFKVFIDPIEEALARLENEAVATFVSNQHFESQKDFAMAVKDTQVAPILFKARKDKTTTHLAFERMELNQQMKLLEKYLDV